MKHKNYDLVVIGAGAAGIMAAISAKRARPELKVLLLDRTFAIGRKILVCGAGRCNITNINLKDGPMGHYYGADDEFIADVFDQFSFAEIESFFNDLGVELYVELKRSIGKLFPVTNRADTITEMLGDELTRLGIEIVINTEVTAVRPLGEGFEVKTSHTEDRNDHSVQTKYCILAAGGKTYPALGSNGSGYDLARSLGHNVVTPVPSALPLEGKNQLSHKLQGTRLEMEVTAVIDGKDVKTSTDEVMFTKYGLSGPAILNISREISIHLNRHGNERASVRLNAFPARSVAEVKQLLRQRWQKRPSQRLSKSLFGLFPNKVAIAFVELAGIGDLRVSEMADDQLNQLINVMCSFTVEITATRGWNEAEFTAGGVDTKEVKQGSLESKIRPGLFLCGEVLNVDGDVGGYNLSWAWSSGFVAGKLLA